MTTQKKIKIGYGVFELKSKKCVNSRWIARWLAEGQECCQCMASCKVRLISKDNSPDLIVTEEEYKGFLKDTLNSLTKEGK